MRTVLFAAAFAALSLASFAAPRALAAQKGDAAKPGAKDAKADAAPAVTPPMLQAIEGVARQLAKGGREREMRDLLAALEALGQEKAAHDKLTKACQDDLEKAKDVLDSLPAGAKTLRATAKQLALVMQALTGDEQQKLARTILRIDGECAEAHALLGNVKVGSNWVSPDQVETRKRRAEILAQVKDAHALPAEIETGTFDDPFIQKACGVTATTATYGIYELRSNFNAEKTARILRESLRASALSSWIRTGKLRLPPNPQNVSQRRIYVLIDSKEKFDALAKDLLAAGELDEEAAKLLSKPETQLTSFSTKKTEDRPAATVRLVKDEADAEVGMLDDIVNMRTRGRATPMTAGHLNWVALIYLSTTLPQWVDKHKGVGGGDTKVETEAMKREREEWMRLAKAGIKGSRQWMAFLAERNRDPAFAMSFVDQIAQITGENLHKCTSIVEYLQEAGLFADAYTKLLPDNSQKPMERYADALGMTVGELESRWRAWLLGGQPGVAERIDKEKPEAWPADALKLLAYLNELREKAFKASKLEGEWKLKFDPDLSEGCLMHADYLVQNPDQRNDDANEEFPDKPGYSPEGAWAASSSSILFGAPTDHFDAIDRLMGSFYGRLALIHPGLLRIGWGSNAEVAVLDSNSLLAPTEKAYLVVWPYHEQSGVPLAYRGNSFPDPVPEGEPGSVDEDGKFGYPITLQTRATDDKGQLQVIVMELFAGKDKVDCWFSTPQQPTNPEYAPSGAWCLIPKTPLRAGTQYKVVADWKIGRALDGRTNAGQHYEWTFKTN